MDDRPVNSIALVHEPVKQNLRSVHAGVTVRLGCARLLWWICVNSVEIAALAAGFTTGRNHYARWAYWRMAERVGVVPTPAIGYTYLTHFTLRPIRQKRPKRQTEVHGGYTDHCPADISGLTARSPNTRFVAPELSPPIIPEKTPA